MRTAEFITLALRQEGYAVTWAGDGETALAHLLSESFDAAIVDVMVPRLDGLTVIRRVREAHHMLPILVLSARDSVESRIAGLKIGADDYLTKPFSISELVARIQVLFRRVFPTFEVDILRVQDLELDVVAHRVHRAGKLIDLQPLEYQLLEYLMRNKGRIVSKSTILERVWDYGFDPHTTIVEARICCLREKVDAGHAVKLIRTVRGFGYVIE